MQQLAFINGSTLLSIRESKGVTREYLARKARAPVEKLEQWENCSKADYPTMRQAERMAKTLLVPLAGLYMDPDKLPKFPRPKTANMRRPFDSEFGIGDSQVNLAIGWLCSLRAQLLATCEGLGEGFAAPGIPNLGGDPVTAAVKLRTFLGLSHAEQFGSESTRKFFLLLRKKMESKGILLLQYGNVEVEACRGIALYFDTCPVIGVNEDDRWPAQSFSAIHEIGHLSKRASTVCNQMDASADRAEEVYCNALAGEFLVPRAELERALAGFDDSKSDDTTEKLAATFSISKEVISRRLMDAGYLSKSEYEERLERYRRELQKEKEQNRERRLAGEPTGFAQPAERVAVNKYGSLYCGALLRSVDRGLYSSYDVGGMLGVKAEKLPGILREMSR